MVEKCVQESLENNPMFSSTDIKNACLGDNFSVLNNMFKDKLRTISKYYEWSLMD